jgi:hypothetical protein
MHDRHSAEGREIARLRYDHARTARVEGAGTAEEQAATDEPSHDTIAAWRGCRESANRLVARVGFVKGSNDM